MNRKILKIVLLSLFLVVLIVVSVSCGKNNPGNTETDGTQESDSNTEVLPPEPEKNMLIENGKVQYCLICPILTDKAAEKFAAEFAASFKEVTGLKMKQYDDYLEVGQTHNHDTYEILVGKTKYDESVEVFEGMKYGDLRIATKGHKIVVAAYTEEQFTEALNWLKENMLSKIDNKENFELKDEFKYESIKDDYAIKSWTIAGNDLSKYKLVYSNFEILTTLETIRDKIAELSGYFIDIVDDKETAPTDYEILFGDTNRQESSSVEKPDYLNYSMKMVGKKLVIRAGGLHSLNKFSQGLLDILGADKTGDVKVEKIEDLSGNYIDDPFNNTSIDDSADVRIMSCNILAEYANYCNVYIPVSLRKEVFFSALDYYQPTVIGLQEFSPAWYKCLEEYKNIDKYEIIKTMSPNGKDYYFSTIMYRTDLLELVESGCHKFSRGNNERGRCVTWAVFKVKATGKTFGFTSTHLDGFSGENMPAQITEWSDIVNKLKEYGSVVSVADWNTIEIWAEYPMLLEASDMVDLKFNNIAEKDIPNLKGLLNVEGSWHDLCIKPEGEGLALDHIFGTKDAFCVRFETLFYNEQIWGSDHSWLIGDIQLAG